jgi:hypothetical protein
MRQHQLVNWVPGVSREIESPTQYYPQRRWVPHNLS